MFASTTLDRSSQLDILAALAGTLQPHPLEKACSLTLSFLIKTTFFASYVLQTTYGNHNEIALVIVGCILSGSINAILGGSVDTTVRRSVKGIKSIFELNRQNIAETVLSIVLLGAALYFGYAQSGPFAKGTQTALAHFSHFSPETTVSQWVTAMTGSAEAVFLTIKALAFFEGIAAGLCLQDKYKAQIIQQADQPWICAQQAVNAADLNPYCKVISTPERIAQTGSGLFISFAYTLTMAASTEAYVAGSILYDWLKILEINSIPLGFALLNFTAIFAYNGFVREGCTLMLDPWARLTRWAQGQAFFTESMDKHAQAKYFGKIVFVYLSAALTYTSSLERAKAGYHKHNPLIDFCNDYLLPIMAMIVNGWASFHLVTAVQQIFTCTTEAERAPFEGSDYRALLTSLTHLKQNETHPFWTALNSGNGPQTLEQARQAYRQARTKQSDEMQPLLASV